MYCEQEFLEFQDWHHDMHSYNKCNVHFIIVIKLESERKACYVKPYKIAIDNHKWNKTHNL